jgi:SAM-dependent methyltransferase
MMTDKTPEKPDAVSALHPRSDDRARRKTLGSKALLRKVLAATGWSGRTYARLALLDPKVLARLMKQKGRERELTDLCMEILQAVGELPEPPGTLHRYLKTPEDKLRPVTEYGNYWVDTRKFLASYVETCSGAEKPVFLDVGGNEGECAKLAEGFRYWLVDLTPQNTTAERVIKADICQPLPIDHGTVDVIFSNQVWEHLERPWLACQELGKLLKPGGLFITATLFAYRYHPFPEDYFRYTHRGLASIHEGFAGTETLVCNYDLAQRRRDIRGGGHFLKSDVVPVDWLGGFRENWYVYYIGRRRPEEELSR